MKVHVITVHLASGEYGHELMLRVADEVMSKFVADPNNKGKAPVVKVYEHGGWWLQYAQAEDGRIVVVGTANDAAHFSPEITRLREKLQRGEFSYEPEIWREAA